MAPFKHCLMAFFITSYGTHRGAKKKIYLPLYFPWFKISTRVGWQGLNLSFRLPPDTSTGTASHRDPMRLYGVTKVVAIPRRPPRGYLDPPVASVGSWGCHNPAATPRGRKGVVIPWWLRGIQWRPPRGHGGDSARSRCDLLRGA